MSNVPTSLSNAIAQAVSSGDPSDPITSSAAWDTYSINGFVMPGVIAPDGIRGFGRKTVWDLKVAKGTKGGVLTLVQEPNARGTITSLLWLPSHFEKWDEAVSTVLSYYSSKQAINDAANIVHPALQQNGINHVVVHEIGAIRHHGKKLYSVTVEYLEWTPQPTKSAVSTPLSASNVTAPELPKAPTPAVAAAQAAYYQSSVNHAQAVGAP